MQFLFYEKRRSGANQPYKHKVIAGNHKEIINFSISGTVQAMRVEPEIRGTPGRRIEFLLQVVRVPSPTECYSNTFRHPRKANRKLEGWSQLFLHSSGKVFYVNVVLRYLAFVMRKHISEIAALSNPFWASLAPFRSAFVTLSLLFAPSHPPSCHSSLYKN